LTFWKVTFGSPRVGNPALATYITNQNLGANYRVTHLNDPVPHLPPESFGFRHTSPEYYITSPNNATVTANDITVCNGISNSDCNGSWSLLDTDVKAHGWYFNGITGCYPGDLLEI
jgi:hypothetical protein